MQLLLVLSRKAGETIIVGDVVQLTVVAVSNSKVRFVITAPLDVPVYRSELKIASDGLETDAPEGNIDHAKAD